MQIIGFIATPLEPKTADGRSFRQFRLATSYGRGEARKTTWFTVQASIDELEADMLAKGQRVQVTGALKLRPYLNRDGKPGVDAVLETEQVELAPGKAAGESAASSVAPSDSRTTSASPAAKAPVAAPAAGPAQTADMSSVLNAGRPTQPSPEDEELPF